MNGFLWEVYAEQLKCINFLLISAFLIQQVVEKYVIRKFLELSAKRFVKDNLLVICFPQPDLPIRKNIKCSLFDKKKFASEEIYIIFLHVGVDFFQTFVYHFVFFKFNFMNNTHYFPFQPLSRLRWSQNSR